jgi:hypothetical protein
MFDIMEYEYKVIELAADDSFVDFDKLQSWFDKDWEYVNSISQIISAGSHSNARRGAIGAIIRKRKQGITL